MATCKTCNVSIPNGSTQCRECAAATPRDYPPSPFIDTLSGLDRWLARVAVTLTSILLLLTCLAALTAIVLSVASFDLASMAAVAVIGFAVAGLLAILLWLLKGFTAKP